MFWSHTSSKKEINLIENSYGELWSWTSKYIKIEKCLNILELMEISKFSV